MNAQPDPGENLGECANPELDTVLGSEPQEATFAALDSVLRQVRDSEDDHFVEETACREVVARIQRLPGTPQRPASADGDVVATIDEYDLLEKIGKGGMGDVFRARHRRLNRIVAIKLLKPELSCNRQAIERFQREMKAVGSVEHENIVKAVDAGKDNDTLFLAMEYVPGISCAELLKQRGPLPIDEACSIIAQAARGLACAHANGLVHRDIKPSNLMIDDDGHVRLLDMGLACFNERLADDHEITRVGQVIGTPDYMSPEQLRDSRSVDSRTDIYSLGATLYKLLTGRAPFADDLHPTIASRVMAIGSEEVAPIHNLRSDVPAELATLTHRLLAKSPHDRVQKAAEVGTELDKMAAGTKEKYAARRWRKTVAVIASGLLAIVLFATVITIATNKGEIIIHAPRDSVGQISVNVLREGKRIREGWILQPGLENRMTVRSGEVDIELPFALHDEFRITSPDNLVVQRNGNVLFRLERTKRNAPAPTSGKRANAHRVTDDELKLVETAWKAGQSTSSIPGLVNASSNFESVPHWTIRPRMGFGLEGQHDRGARAVDLHPSGLLYAYRTPFDFRIADTASGRIRTLIPHRVDSSGHTSLKWDGIRFSPDGKFFAASDDSHVQLYRTSGQFVSGWNLLEKHSDDPEFVAWSGMRWLRDSKRMLLWGTDRAFVVNVDGSVVNETAFPGEGARPTRDVLYESQCFFTAADASPDGQTIVFGCEDGTVLMWHQSAAPGAALQHFDKENRSRVTGTAFSPNGDFLVVCHDDQEIAIRDASGALQNHIQGTGILSSRGETTCLTVAWSPDSRHFVDSLGVIRNVTGDVAARIGDYDNRSVQTRLPFWTEESIAFISVASKSLSKYERGGTIDRFTPSGAELPAPSFPYPLVPLSATLTPGATVRSRFSSTENNHVIHDWSLRGELKQRRTYRIEGSGGTTAWNGGRNKIAIQSNNDYALIDLATNELQLMPWVRSCEFNRADQRIAAYTAKRRANMQLQVLDPDGEHPQILEYEMSEHLPGHSETRWSMDGKFLAAVSRDLSNNLVAAIWNPDESNRPLLSKTIGGSEPVSLSWNPSGKLLCVITTDKESLETANLVCVDRTTGNRTEARIDWPTHQLNGSGDHRLWWLNDSQFQLMGSTWSIGELGGLTQVHRYQRDLSPSMMDRYSVARIPLADNSYTLDLLRKQLEQENGDTIPITISGQPGMPANASSTSVHATSNKLLLRAGTGYGAALTINLVDLETGHVEWSAITFSDDQCVVLDAAGAIQSGPENIDEYLTWVVQHPGGREVALTRRQFHDRIGLGGKQRAMNWVLDMGGEIMVEGSENWIKRLDIPQVSDLPAPDSVTSVRLGRVKMIADASVGLLCHLTSVRDLDLSDTRITAVPDLSAMGSLEKCGLAGSSIDNIDGLTGLTSLLELNLANTQVTSDIGIVLSSLSNLSTLDLSRTRISEFIFADLTKLEHLTTLRLSGVSIPEDSIARFREAVPNCHVEFE